MRELYLYNELCDSKWNIKTWDLSQKDKMVSWISKHKNKYQIREIFVNNAYGIEYKTYDYIM